MAYHRKENQSESFLNLVITVLLAPFFVLKWTGDLLIFSGNFFTRNIINSYKFISQLKTRVKNIRLLAKKTKAKRPRGRPPKGKKERIIYRKYPGWLEKTKRFIYRTKFRLFILKQRLLSVPKRIYYYLYLNLVFIKIKYFLLGALIVTAVFTFYQFNSFIEGLPNPNYLTQKDPPTTSKIYDRSGNLLYEVYEEQNRLSRTLLAIPPALRYKLPQRARIRAKSKKPAIGGGRMCFVPPSASTSRRSALSARRSSVFVGVYQGNLPDRGGLLRGKGFDRQDGDKGCLLLCKEDAEDFLEKS